MCVCAAASIARACAPWARTLRPEHCSRGTSLPRGGQGLGLDHVDVDVEPEDGEPGCAREAERALDVAAREHVGHIVVDAGDPRGRLVNALGHQPLLPPQVEGVQRVGRRAAVLGDVLCGGVVDEPRLRNWKSDHCYEGSKHKVKAQLK